MQTEDDPVLDALLLVTALLIVVTSAGLVFLLADWLNQYFHWWIPLW